jgi:ABC-type multidrug transport system ATPase subunit
MDKINDIHPISVSVNNFNVTLEQKTLFSKKSIQVLKNISFKMSPGQIVAVLGSSGSGKTTLLNALAGRQKLNGQANSSILFNQNDPAPFYKSRHVAYVQQHDHLIPYLTVRETLRYTAELRLDRKMSKKEKYEYVEKVILELGLKDCADTGVIYFCNCQSNWR